MVARTPSPNAATSAVEQLMMRHFKGWRHERRHSRSHYGQMLSGAALVYEFMKFVGVEVIFGVPGGASLPLSDALTHGHVDGAFRYVLTGHEQGAAFEAAGYAAASGRPGFCTATSGPGATNLITGLADAFRDSRPVVALTGNTATTAEPEAFQAIDIVGITDGKATKASFRAERPEQVQDMLVRAYHRAVTGRPGATLVDFPKDVQVTPVLMRPWEDIILAYSWLVPAGDEGALDQAARLLAGAERPLLYVGHGVTLAEATGELRALSETFAIPMVSTVHGLGAGPANDALNLQMIGMHGSMVANIAPYLADVVVAIGVRFDDRVVGARPDAFAPHTQVIHIDIDASQLNRVRSADLVIHADAGVALRHLVRALHTLQAQDHTTWLQQLAEIRHALPTPTYDDPQSVALSHEFVYSALADALAKLGGDAVTTFDVGTHQMKGAQCFPITAPRSFITSGGMGSMGCALPMAAGASFARPGATVVAAVGDGGFVMSSHELDTIGAYKLPVKIVLFDDAALGMVSNWHDLFFDGRNLTSDRRRGRIVQDIDVTELTETLRGDLNGVESADDLAAVVCRVTAQLADGEWPLFAATAASYGIPAVRVHTKEQLRTAIQHALAIPGPYLLHVMLPACHQVYPLMEPGTTPQDMVWRETAPGSGERVYACEHFDYEGRQLRPVVYPLE